MRTSLTELALEATNRAFLAQWDPLLLVEIEGHAVAGELVHGPHAPSLRFGEDPIHDLVDPVGEARAVVGRARHGLHLHFGFGLGYFLEADQPADHGLALVYEPCPGFVLQAMRAIPLENLFRRTRVRLCCSFARFRYLYLKYQGCHVSNQLFISRHHARAFGEAFGLFQDLIERQASELVIKRANRLFPTVLRSTLESLPSHVRLPGWELWRDRLLGKPALIIGAGPSLDKNIAQLAPHREQFLIFAVARVAAVLEANGITPDFLVHVEAQDFRQFIQGCDKLDQAIFLLADQTHPYYYAFPHRQTYVFQSNSNPVINSLVACHPQCRREIVKSGGSVATAAFYAAFLAGCNPLVLLGQDLALGDSCYAGGEWDHKSGEQRRQVPGYFGGKVTTIANYHNNIVWYEKSLPALRQMDPQRRFINATEGGALIRGFECMPLRHVLFQLPRQHVDFELPDHSASPILAPTDLAAFHGALRGFCLEIRCIRQAFEDAEQQVLAQLSASPQAEPTLDPTPHLAALLASLEHVRHFEELCKGEFALLRLLERRLGQVSAGRALDLTRSWAALAAIHQGLSELELLTGG